MPSEITPEKIGQFIAQAKNALTMLRAIAGITPTAVDDNLLLALSRFIEIVEPFAAEPWFVKLVDLILSYFWSRNDFRPVFEPLAKLA